MVTAKQAYDTMSNRLEPNVYIRGMAEYSDGYIFDIVEGGKENEHRDLSAWPRIDKLGQFGTLCFLDWAEEVDAGKTKWIDISKFNRRAS